MLTYTKRIKRQSLYNLLTNQRPPLPTDIDDDETADKHEALPFPDTVSSGIKSLILMMLNTNRMRRPQSIEAIKEAELSKKEETVQAPKQQPTPKHVADDDEEGTIIANPQSKKDEKDAKPTPEPQPIVNPQPTQDIYTYTSQENNDNKGSGKGIIIAMAVTLVFVIIILVSYGGCGNKIEPEEIVDADYVEQTNTHPVTQNVNSMKYETAIGACSYTGPVDENNKPHGKGEARFNDGRYYEGDFEHGELTGDNCYFNYANGDSFEGKFRSNCFYYGKYTIAEDGSYFEGYYNSKGQPISGTWYNKKGKVIEKI